MFVLVYVQVSVDTCPHECAYYRCESVVVLFNMSESVCVYLHWCVDGCGAFV